MAIEHLEDHLSKWLMAEYKHSRDICRSKGVDLVITNVKNPHWRNTLKSKLGIKCFAKSIVELEGELYSTQEKVVVLDPLASDLLRPSEAEKFEVIVVGGILGDNPPRGRTSKLLSSRLPKASKRSLGPYQLSIDGAVYVALKVLQEGLDPLAIPLKINPIIAFRTSLGLEVEVMLPFAYPLDDEGRLVMPPELPELLARGLAYEEYRELR